MELFNESDILIQVVRTSQGDLFIVEHPATGVRVQASSRLQADLVASAIPLIVLKLLAAPASEAMRDLATSVQSLSIEALSEFSGVSDPAEALFRLGELCNRRQPLPPSFWHNELSRRHPLVGSMGARFKRRRRDVEGLLEFRGAELVLLGGLLSVVEPDGWDVSARERGVVVFPSIERVLDGDPEAFSRSLSMSLLEPSPTPDAALEAYLSPRVRQGEPDFHPAERILGRRDAPSASWIDGAQSVCSWVLQISGKLLLLEYGEYGSAEDTDVRGAGMNLFRSCHPQVG